MRLVLLTFFLGHFTITAYRAIPSQTDSTPFYTSTNEKVRVGGCAISRDLLCGACRRLHHRCKRPDNPTKIHYGDWLYIDGYGFRQVNDVMGSYLSVKIKKKWTKQPIIHHIDIFVNTLKEERAVKVKHKDVFKIDIHKGA